MSKPTVLVVDDEPLNVAVLSELLCPDYRVLGARSGPIALELVETETPDLVLLDVMMPDMDGYAVLRALRGRGHTSTVPVMFVTALGADVDEERGLSMGACDYIAKPIKPAVVLARVRTQIELKAARDRLTRQNQWLEAELERRLHDTLLGHDLMLCALAQMAETRDNDTGNHILRTQGFVEALGRRLQRHPDFADELDDAQLRRIVKAAPMHDIGKIGIADHILLKPGKLSADEFAEMKTHACRGAQALDRSIERASSMHAAHGRIDEAEAVLHLRMARTIACWHHERWDGSGYPDRLAGDAIPLAARLMALADVYDALTTRRVYKPAWTAEKSAAHIESESGRHFDPRVVAAFREIRPEFEAVVRRLAD